MSLLKHSLIFFCPSTGCNLEPIHVKDRPREVKNALCSADKARKILNYKTNTKLETAIRMTAEYIKKNGTREFKYNLPLEIQTEITQTLGKKY